MVDVVDDALSRPVITPETKRVQLNGDKTYGVFANIINGSERIIVNVLNWQQTPAYQNTDKGIRHELINFAQGLNSIAIDHTTEEQRELLKERTEKLVNDHPEAIGLLKELGLEASEETD